MQESDWYKNTSQGFNFQLIEHRSRFYFLILVFTPDVIMNIKHIFNKC